MITLRWVDVLHQPRNAIHTSRLGVDTVRDMTNDVAKRRASS